MHMQIETNFHLAKNQVMNSFPKSHRIDVRFIQNSLAFVFMKTIQY